MNDYGLNTATIYMILGVSNLSTYWVGVIMYPVAVVVITSTARVALSKAGNWA